MALGRFHKMHGLGNDFVIIDARGGPVPAITPARAAAIADRRRGIGCDQLILLTSGPDGGMAMTIYNADGSAAEACGNATRCVVALIGEDVAITTPGGPVTGRQAGDQVSVNMGQPRFDWSDIPLAEPMPTQLMPLGWGELERPDALSMGNPHLIFFADPQAVDLAALAPEIQRDPLFPKGVNVGVARVAGEGTLELSVFERGAGLTGACGTGACAAAVAAIRRGLVRSPVTVRQAGGELNICWAPGEEVEMRGPATHVFSGEADWESFG